MPRKREKLAPINFAKAIEDIENLLRATHDIKQKKQSYDYEGEEITHYSVLACSTNIKDSVSSKGMKYNREQNRSLLKVILSKVFQLGYCQAKIEDDNDDAKQLLMAIAMSTAKDFGKKLKEEKKKKS